MNIYVVYVPHYTYTEWIDSEIGGPEFDGSIFEIVQAETPGKAKSQIVNDYDLEFTHKMHVLTLMKDIDPFYVLNGRGHIRKAFWWIARQRLKPIWDAELEAA